MKTLNSEVCQLQDMQLGARQSTVELVTSGVFTDEMRLCVMELLSL